MSAASREDFTKPVHLQVVARNVSAEEIAALVVILSAVGGANENHDTPRSTSTWAGRARQTWHSFGLPH